VKCPMLVTSTCPCSTQAGEVGPAFVANGGRGSAQSELTGAREWQRPLGPPKGMALQSKSLISNRGACFCSSAAGELMPAFVVSSGQGQGIGGCRWHLARSGTDQSERNS